MTGAKPAPRLARPSGRRHSAFRSGAHVLCAFRLLRRACEKLSRATLHAFKANAGRVAAWSAGPEAREQPMFKGSFTALITPFKGGKVDDGGIPAAGRVADRGGHARAGAGRHHRREPDAQPRGAQARRRAVHQDGQEARAGDRRRRLQLHRGGHRLHAPRQEGGRRRGAALDRLLQQADAGRASIATSRRSAMPSTSRSSSTTCRCAPSSTSQVATMARCAELKNVVGVKDATANVGPRHAAAPGLRQGLRPALRRGRHGAGLHGARRARLHLRHLQRGAAAVRANSRTPASRATGRRRWSCRTS